MCVCVCVGGGGGGNKIENTELRGNKMDFMGP